MKRIAVDVTCHDKVIPASAVSSQIM